MKKDEKTEKENTAISMSEEKNSPESGKEKEREREQSTSHSNTNNKSAVDNLSERGPVRFAC